MEDFPSLSSFLPFAPLNRSDRTSISRAEQALRSSELRDSWQFINTFYRRAPFAIILIYSLAPPPVRPGKTDDSLPLWAITAENLSLSARKALEQTIVTSRCRFLSSTAGTPPTIPALFWSSILLCCILTGLACLSVCTTLTNINYSRRYLTWTHSRFYVFFYFFPSPSPPPRSHRGEAIAVKVLSLISSDIFVMMFSFRFLVSSLVEIVESEQTVRCRAVF